MRSVAEANDTLRQICSSFDHSNAQHAGRMDDPRGLARAAQEVARCIALDKRPSRVRPSDGETHFGPLFTIGSHRVLPPVVLQQYDSESVLWRSCVHVVSRTTALLIDVQYKCFVGLLPEVRCAVMRSKLRTRFDFVFSRAQIRRAWITFDNRLFLWKYDDDKDFNVWDGLDQIIVSVGLVIPKPGVFVETIRYLLVVTTPV